MSPFENKNQLRAHLACDLFELLVALDMYEEMSGADIRDLLRDCGIEDERLHIWAGDLMSTDPGEDAVESLLAEYFQHFKLRSTLLADRYPFVVESGLLKKREIVGDPPRYFFILACSKLDMLPQGLRVRGGLYFEKIGAIAARAAFGPTFSIHSLGTNSSEREIKVFSNKKDKMICGVARWLNDRIDEEFFADARGSAGDHGVDIIGRIRVDRLGRGALTILGQCAASSNDTYWKKKRNDVDKFKEVVLFSSDPITCLFIPLFYRKINGDWQNLTGLKKLFLFDRYRMAQVLGEALCEEGIQLLSDLSEGYRKQFEGLAAA